MFRLKCEIAYDGTDFYGFQIQRSGRTVQGVFEEALVSIHKGPAGVRVYPAGRTDTGVHARHQVLHFDSALVIAEEGWKRALNARLPDDVVVHSVQDVNPSFHARFDAVKKEYRYRVLQGPKQDVFRSRYTYYYPFDLQLPPMQEAVKSIVGTHDFTSFCAARTNVQTKIRTAEAVDINQIEDELVFRLVGNGFLRQMVRILVGVLMDIGRGRLEPKDMERILVARDRREAGKTVPGCGLTLWKVTY